MYAKMIYSVSAILAIEASIAGVLGSALPPSRRYVVYENGYSTLTVIATVDALEGSFATPAPSFPTDILLKSSKLYPTTTVAFHGTAVHTLWPSGRPVSESTQTPAPTHASTALESDSIWHLLPHPYTPVLLPRPHSTSSTLSTQTPHTSPSPEPTDISYQRPKTDLNKDITLACDYFCRFLIPPFQKLPDSAHQHDTRKASNMCFEDCLKDWQAPTETRTRTKTRALKKTETQIRRDEETRESLKQTKAKLQDVSPTFPHITWTPKHSPAGVRLHHSTSTFTAHPTQTSINVKDTKASPASSSATHRLEPRWAKHRHCLKVCGRNWRENNNEQKKMRCWRNCRRHSELRDWDNCMWDGTMHDKVGRMTGCANGDGERCGYC